MKKYIYILSICLLALLSCEDCCEDLEVITEDPVGGDDMPPPDICEGDFYYGSLTEEPTTGQRFLTFETFSQPLTDPLGRTDIEVQNINLFNEFYSPSFGTYDQDNDRYAFFYLLDDSDAPNTLYLADTNTTNTTAIQTSQDQAAPVFLNGNLYTINLQTEIPNVDFEILQLDQTTGNATQIASSFATVDGEFFNASISSATNGIDTIYFLGVKTLVSYNVLSNTVQVQDINIPYDADIQTALSGIEYRFTTNELIAIHHKINSPTAIEELVSIDTTSGEVTPIINIESNLSEANNGSIEFLTNSTAYSSCEDTYYVTEIVDPETSDSPNSFLIAIDLVNNTLSEIQTPDFLYGLTINDDN